MNEFTRNFNKKHKDWLQRTEEYLLSSNWHELKLDQTLDAEGLVQYTKAKELNDMKQKMLKNDRMFVTNLTSRLKFFISKTEGEKHLPSNKEVRTRLLDIINIFLDNCDVYVSDNDLQAIGDQDLRNLEIKFQDLIFNSKIKIEDDLTDMGAYEDFEEVRKKFYRDDKASLIMREPLVLIDSDIRLKCDNIQVDWNVNSSNEMLINMNPKDIPPYNHAKHFFDQENSTIQFWQEEYNKMQEGININGYRIHPWLYHHLNIFRTKIPISKDKEEIMCPPLRDNEWFFVENLKVAEDAGNKGILLYGTRRFSKSTIMASYIEWKAKTKANSVATLTGGSESDLIDLLDKVDTSMLYSPEAFKLVVQKVDGDRTNGTMHLGLKRSASELIDFSQIQVKNLAAGRKSATQKTAGGAPSAFVVDEIGKFAFLKSYLAAQPSFATPHGYKCVPILSGTGGEADLSIDAMTVLNNPDSYDLLPMDWDLLESKIDPDQITWKRRTFATFMPGQMGYEVGFNSIKKGFGDFLGIKKADDLNKIQINQADFKTNNEVLDAILEKAEKEKGSKGVVLVQQKKVQNPRDPEDCFIATKNNPFPAEEAKMQKDRIIETGDTGRKVFLDVDAHGSIYEINAEDKPLADFPHPGGFIDAPIQLFHSLPTTPQPFGLYVAGMDDYKHDQSDGDSVGTLYIWKRQWFDPSSLTLVASYAARPNPRSKFDRQCYLLLKAFNAICFHENEDNNFKTYLDNKHETEIYLAKGLDFSAELNLANNGNRKYGWAAIPQNINFGHSLVKKMLEKEYEVEKEDGTKFSVLGVNRIKDVGFLNEIMNYTPEGNFDRIRAMMGALMYTHYLDATHQFPRSMPTEEEVRKAKEKRQNRRHSRTSPFRQGGGGGYFRR